MEYPTLYVKQKSRQMADAFLGYNHNLRIGEGEFYDMKNMTSDYYPVLSPRKKRGVYLEGNINGIIAKEHLCRVESPDFMIYGANGDVAGINMELTDDPKDLISMGAYVIIMPDKKWVNTVPNSKGEYEWGKIEAEYYSSDDSGLGLRTKISTCDKTGSDYTDISVSTDPPENPGNGDLWMDVSGLPVTVKKYFAGSKSWGVIESYVKIKIAGIAHSFNEGDGVMISGMPFDEFNGLQTLYGCYKDEKHNDDYILIKGAFYAPDYPTEGYNLDLSVTRKMPDLDFITECNNRLWGCKYGTNEDDEVVNEIYASKLGDFKNWNCFMGVSTDSYRASCGSDGPFTGAFTHLGYPLFFKENGLHKVYGDFPSNFSIQYTPCRGVQKGCHNSLAIVGDTLFYKSRNAVCAYDGSLPVEISSALGNIRYYNAVAGAHGNKYYINMSVGPNKNGTYNLFVYDVAKSMWHKEDNIRVDAFCSYMDELYAIDHETKSIITMLSSGEYDTEPVRWMVETGIWGMSMPDMKYISKLLIRMSLESGASVKVSIQYDSVGDFEQVCNMTATSLRSFFIPVRPRRCDHFRIRIEGVGQGKIYSITKTIEQGSDVS